MKKQKIIFIFIGIIVSEFFSSSVLTREDFSFRRARSPEVTPKKITPVADSTTEPWADLLVRIVKDAFSNDSITVEPHFIDRSFEAVRHLGISPSQNWIRTLIRHIWFRNYPSATLTEDITIASMLAIYNGLHNYIFENLAYSAENIPIITYRPRINKPVTVETVDPEDIAIENLYLEEQKRNPNLIAPYIQLEDLYTELVEKYPDRLYYYWQLSWVYGVLGRDALRKAVFIEGAKQEIRPLPYYTSRTALADIICQNRKIFAINWESYENGNLRYIAEHALKYYLHFPEIFMPQGTDNPILPASREFADAVDRYDLRAREIIYSDGTEFYAFYRDDQAQYLAYRPDTLEVVGFRIQQDKKGDWQVAIDTFYKASSDMIESLRDEGLIELLVESTGRPVIGLFDAQPDAFRQVRLKEQLTERKLFGLTETMYEPALQKIAELILSRRTERGIIMLSGTSSAGKSPGIEIIQEFCRQNGRTVKVLPMDFYFLDREKTPLRNGQKDYDNPHALDIERFNQDIRRLLAGEEVELPRYDFGSGRVISDSGIKIRLNPGELLAIDGIHALNSELTGFIENMKVDGRIVPQLRIFIDASPVLRFTRRMVRDFETRNITPLQTVLQWENVRHGEIDYIYPAMENADVVLNTDITEDEFCKSLLYTKFRDDLELALLQAEMEGDRELMDYVRLLMDLYQDKLPGVVPFYSEFAPSIP